MKLGVEPWFSGFKFCAFSKLGKKKKIADTMKYLTYARQIGVLSIYIHIYMYVGSFNFHSNPIR